MIRENLKGGRSLLPFRFSRVRVRKEAGTAESDADPETMEHNPQGMHICGMPAGKLAMRARMCGVLNSMN